MIYKNKIIGLSDGQLVQIIRKIHQNNKFNESGSLINDLGRCRIDTEIVSGKTYVYIKTIHVLNMRYGWDEFILVVSSIAIRKDVNKSFKNMEVHFMEHYGKKEMSSFIRVNVAVE